VLDNALKGRETANFEFPLYTKDRQRVEVLLNATTRRDVSGAVVGMIGVGQDITERKQVEEEKTRVAQELQTFIDTANAPIFGIDAHGLVNEWNNKAAEITGFSKHEVMGKDLVEVYITEEFRASVRKVLDDALQGIEKSNFEFPLFTSDQRRVEVLLNATTRRDVTGVIVGVIGVGQDITEMRRLMEQETLLFQASVPHAHAHGHHAHTPRTYICLRVMEQRRSCSSASQLLATAARHYFIQCIQIYVTDNIQYLNM
jgi:PAS domain S-box-containing protein